MFRQGFSLIELLVVISIIGILAGLILLALGNSRTKAQDTRIRSGLGQLRVMAEDFYYANGLSYAAYEACLTDSFASCGAGVGDDIEALVTDINDASPEDLTAESSATEFCVAARLNQNDEWLMVDQTGAFTETDDGVNPCPGSP